MTDNERIVLDDFIFDFYFEMAANDAMNRVSKEGDKKKLIKKENNKIKSAVKEYVESIINGDNNLCFDDAVNKITEENNKSNEKIEHFSFGKIQKLINMTIKYLYVKYYDNPKIAIQFDICDAPMDSYMMKFVFECYKYFYNEKPSYDKYKAWSTLKNKEDEYESFQKAIDSIIYKSRLKINRIMFDYFYWSRAKETCGDRILKEEIKKICDNMNNDRFL